MAAEHTGTNQQRLRDTAKELSEGREDLGFKWKSGKDKKDFVNLLNKVANLLDEVPVVQGTFSLGLHIDKDTKYTRRAPVIAVSSSEIEFDDGMGEALKMATTACNQLELALKELDALSKENNTTFQRTMAGLVEGYLNRANDDEKLDFFFKILGGPIKEVASGRIKLTKQGQEDMLKWALFETLKEKIFGDDEEDDGEEDENEDDECDESDESDIPQPILDIINKMEKDGEKVVVNKNTTIVKMDGKQTMDLLKELAKDSEEEDCDCTRGKCEHDCKCGKSKCSGKSKKS